jgi:diadenosine tetraphosphate (Ap4A) HIT family hydrolase
MSRHAHPAPPGWHLHPQLADDTHPLAHWPLCEVRLMDDAHHPWLILVPRVENAVDITDLDAAQQSTLMREIDRAARALQATVKPHKLNVAALGNVVPQLHVHVIARYRDDIAWPRPVWGTATAQPYSPEQLVERVALLGTALSA